MYQRITRAKRSARLANRRFFHRWRSDPARRGAEQSGVEWSDESPGRVRHRHTQLLLFKRHAQPRAPLKSSTRLPGNVNCRARSRINAQRAYCSHRAACNAAALLAGRFPPSTLHYRNHDSSGCVFTSVVATLFLNWQESVQSWIRGSLNFM